jgi:hypothetical protein
VLASCAAALPSALSARARSTSLKIPASKACCEKLHWAVGLGRLCVGCLRLPLALPIPVALASLAALPAFRRSALATLSTALALTSCLALGAGSVLIRHGV